MPRIFINNCSIEELMTVPGIGAKVADKILELREAKGDLELDDLNQVPYLGITQPLLDCLDFTSFENKEEMGSDLSDASVSSIKGSVALGRARTGALTIAFLNSSNAFSCSSPH
jgi:predicted DNA-binding helix-hairpin-helix protein